MSRKIFGPKSITYLIYGLLMMLPFLAIGAKCIYVQANPNAKDSYSDRYVETSVNLDSSNINSLYVQDINITFTFASHNTQWNAAFGFSEISLDLNRIFNVEASWNKFYLYKDTQNIMFYTTNNQTYTLSASNRTFNTFTYKVDLNVSSDKYIYNYGVASIITFTTDTLDNVFDYSVSELIDENNGFVPKIDFVGLLNGVFSENSNHIYLKLTNWYLNYALLISTIYILFLAMLWFVNLCRNILERSMNIGNGVDD